MWDTDSFESLVPSNDELHDMSTRRGRLRRRLYKCRWILCPLAVLAIPFTILLVIFGFGVWDLPDKPPSISVDHGQLLQALVLSNSSSVYSKLSLSNGVLQIHGDSSKPINNVQTPGSTSYYQNFDEFPSLRVSLSSLGVPNDTMQQIHSIEIKWFKLNGLTFPAELEPFSNLTSLKLDNVSIVEFFRPTPLPRLKELLIYQVLEDEQNNSNDYKVQNFNLSSGNFQFLDSIFFFQGDNFKGFISELSTTKVNVSVWLDGSIIFSSDPKIRELRLSLRTCHPILTLVTVKYERLTLGNCNDLQPDSIPTNTKILTLYLLSNINTQLLYDMLTRLKNLSQLFVELPDSGITLDLRSLPQETLSLLSVSSTPIRISEDYNWSFPHLKTFYFGGTNQYRWISAAGNGTETELSSLFLSNFNKIFPNIQKVGVFELNEERYSILATLLNSTAITFMVQGFSRANSIPSFPAQDEVETLLKASGIPDTTEFFELKKRKGRVMGRSLEYDEQIRARYTMLGWSSIDTWNKYVHVRDLLNNGFFLG